MPVDEFLASVEGTRREQAEVIRELMGEVTGVDPVMWGPSIVGYGSMEYSDAGYRWPIVGFSPRKAAMTLYVLDGTADESPLLARLGPHTTGRSCLYLKKLDGVDLDVLRELIAGAWRRSAP